MALAAHSRVGSLEDIFHNTTVTNSNEGSPICLKCGGPVHFDENLCPSVAFLEGYMHAVWFCVPYDHVQYTDIWEQRQHQNEPRNIGNDGVAKKKKKKRAKMVVVSLGVLGI
ncbi:hypothetical protein BDV33DRAFT_198346 [Aspergillus novoparasiticus]|uniref:Uncharacterized protein n=1 Tax=Aspergillus novoparasiticus TaxID=986946 RepID=A0A5N6FAL7_9EURO|nr:hypothetical protein BDV33DRAFT_198346 [Aspergillus novoparasiticus]